MEDEENKEKIHRLRQAMYSRSISKKLKPKPRRSLEPLDHDLPEDWQEPEAGVDDTEVAPWGINIARRVMKWLLAASVVFFIVAAGVFVYYFTIGPGGEVAAPGNVDITVRGPLSVAGGEPAELQVVVTNRNQAPLELADLIITYPPGTRSPSDLVSDLPRQRISLGTIEPGGTRQGTVSAVFVGTEGEQKNVHVELEYRVADSNAIFASETDYQLSFTSSPVAVSIDANREVASGQQFALNATISSNSDTVVRDVVVEADYPFGFTPESAAPEPVRDGVWEIGDLNPGDEEEIEVRGRMEGQESEERTFRFTAGTRSDQSVEHIEVPLTEGTHRVAVARPFIGLDVEVNKETGQETAAVEPGETVNVRISWTNNLSSPIANAVLVADLEGIDVRGETVQVNNGFYRSSDRTVLWDRSTTGGDFTRLAPGESGSVTFTFQVPEEESLLTTRDGELAVTVHASGDRVGQADVPETLQSTASQVVRLVSNLQIVAQGFYYSNPFDSTGPLPPQVNEETTYAVVFTVANTSNTVEEGKLTAHLPSYVRWLGTYSPSSEDLRFNGSDGTVEWDIGSIEPGVGVEGSEPRQVVFEVGVTPSATQIGQTPDIVDDISFTGIDTFAEVPIDKEHPAVTTNLLDDPGFSSTEAEVVSGDE